jgi:hypothetical protein
LQSTNDNAAGRLELECVDFNLRSALEEIVDLMVLNAHEKGRGGREAF